MKKYTEITTIKLSKTQKETLLKMKAYKVNVSQFIRNAIKEKIQREYKDLIPKPENYKAPF